MRPPRLRLYTQELVVDGFAGGGGASTGLSWILGRSPDIAINHNAEALAMHRVNHPDTEHRREDLRHADPVTVCQGKRVGVAWFSPDCTHHSKAKGGVPFRDKHKARKIRGLAWVIVRWAESRVKPRLIFMENVEEIVKWGPLVEIRPGEWVADKTQAGKYWRKLVAKLRALGYVVEWRELVASDFGSPTKRKRLFMIARCDGKPIVWPRENLAPAVHSTRRTAADCMDFDIPVPSIFLTPTQAKAWARHYGVPAPRRPLAAATLRRIARGVMRYVVEAERPFIVPGGAYAPSLIQTSYGEKKGQAPRTLNLFEPLGTIVGQGIKHSLVAAFLAKHNGGHEATGQTLHRAMDTVVCRENKALVSAHLTKFYGTSLDGQAIDRTMPTVTASGTHVGMVAAFLMKYYGTGVARSLEQPLSTSRTKDCFGLVTVTIAGEQYAIVDIGMRMLTPRELFRAQGFGNDYVIDHGICIETGARLHFTKGTQTRLVGNSVPPHFSAALAAANLAGMMAS